MIYDNDFKKRLIDVEVVTKEYVDSLAKGIDFGWLMKMKERQWKMKKILKRNEQK